MVVSLRPALLVFASSPKRWRVRTCWASRKFVKSVAIAQLSSEQAYQFRDDGGEVELRVQIPSEFSTVTAKNVAVDAYDNSLSVALLFDRGVRNLLNITNLYGRIKAAETVWYIDEEEVVLSLKKLNQGQHWPGALETWEFLGEGVRKMLNSTSVYVVGGSTEVNSAVATELARALRYVPILTKNVMEELLKTPIDTISEEEVTKIEAQVLSTLSQQLRVVVATLGGERGAASQHKHWRYLHSGCTIWLSQSQARDQASAEEEAVKAKQEGANPYSSADLVVAYGGWDEGAARPVSEGCLKAIKYLIESDQELPGKKRLYVRLGARGDWPDIMPPGWDPDAEAATVVN